MPIFHGLRQKKGKMHLLPANPAATLADRADRHVPRLAPRPAQNNKRSRIPGVVMNAQEENYPWN